MKKALISLIVIAGVGALAAGLTIAFFQDTETSTGNVFTAGSIDLKVDHVRQTYNGVDCRTCDLTLISDTTNIVVEKNGVPLEPYNAVFLSWIHPRWTAQNDSQLAAAGARWIWEQDPVKQEDTTTDAEYTFRKQFEWWGPITGSDLWFAVGSDNSVEVWLNGIKVGENTGEYGYQQEHMLHIPGANITSNIVQGLNVLEFKVKNWGLPNGTPSSNPAGLIYKFYIDGLCGDDFFKTHCELWGEKDLEDETLFIFDDVKPGDNGLNIISLHVYDNDAWMCMYLENSNDDENELVDPEIEAGDDTEVEGELSENIEVIIWADTIRNNEYDDGEETVLAGPATLQELFGEDGVVSIADSQVWELFEACQTEYIGIFWCAGEIETEGGLDCDGYSMGNMTQTDIFTTDVVFYTVQHRNNLDFVCDSLFND